MKIISTSEGGLSIVTEGEAEWRELEMIPEDAGISGKLASSFASLMEEESEWDEWVVPDLEHSFGSQVTYVKKALQEGGKEIPAKVSITPENVEKWYGALNQARLNLQAKFQLSEILEDDFLKNLPDEVAGAYFRDRFYASLQSFFIDFIIERSNS